MAFCQSTIPRLDLALAQDVASETRFLMQLRHAITNIGFLYIDNHGVPETLIAQIIDALPIIFALPPEAKAQSALAKSPHFLGYSNYDSEMTAGVLDHREQFEFATDLPATWTPGRPLYERLRGPNSWPSAYPAIQPLVESYIGELTALGDRFLRLVARALSLPAETFHAFLSEQHRLKMVHYPALGESGTLRQGVGPHKDSSGWWTFLLQASPPHVKGLQVLDRRGRWIDVPPIPGTLVVNVGQAFEVITHGVCKATTHRVLVGSEERFSVPFFQGVRWNLSKEEAWAALAENFGKAEFLTENEESHEAREVDSSFMKGKYDTWGESQLRTKIRSHRDVGQAFYASVFDGYVNDD